MEIGEVLYWLPQKSFFPAASNGPSPLICASRKGQGALPTSRTLCLCITGSAAGREGGHANQMEVRVGSGVQLQWGMG